MLVDSQSGRLVTEITGLTHAHGIAGNVFVRLVHEVCVSVQRIFVCGRRQ